ncbi:hypothetical protein A2188_01320 [Candidatus Woesebacteria bacterium RIFOXYA1_FULL_43_9]|uniref:Uncharacterized protein n=1 Tax=Candidatus Woesebacteria bacterium RIFOXYA1_FULL_43_9 TaxID=1802534 RepID=A0A1F8CP58_9BACT|nr:MAG: hypothetical protein A2188_01320 [Candidatus Woesebacteria bacterium RIFOXYA1_FULL_43_9]
MLLAPVEPGLVVQLYHDRWSQSLVVHLVHLRGLDPEKLAVPVLLVLASVPTPVPVPKQLAALPKDQPLVLELDYLYLGPSKITALRF